MPRVTNKYPRWQKSKTAVYNLSYHFIWCTKYRKLVLIDRVEKRLKELIYEKASEHEWTIKSLEVMPDHVHVFISVFPQDSPQHIAFQLKGFSSRYLRIEFADLKNKLPTLWTRSYYCESVGHISERTIKKYIEDQKNK